MTNIELLKKIWKYNSDKMPPFWGTLWEGVQDIIESLFMAVGNTLGVILFPFLYLYRISKLLIFSPIFLILFKKQETIEFFEKMKKAFDNK